MKEENKSLSEKIFDRKLVLGDDISKIFAKHVKEKIQNAQRKLKEINKLKFPLGCDTNLRDATTTCGDKRFGNRL